MHIGAGDGDGDSVIDCDAPDVRVKLIVRVMEGLPRLLRDWLGVNEMDGVIDGVTDVDGASPVSV